MIASIDTAIKECGKCHETKSVDEFHRNRTKKDGYTDWCKVCDSARKRKWNSENAERRQFVAKHYNETHPESSKKAITKWAKSNPQHYGIRKKLFRAVASGKLVKPDACSECGTVGRVVGHHEDYDKPLNVQWVCSRCHYAIHEEKRRKETA